jgi:NADH dehydrogenase FAD-containing subunit
MFGQFYKITTVGLFNAIWSFKSKIGYYDMGEETREPVHIVGNGWATYYFVKNLNKNKFIPIVISPNVQVLDTTKLVDLATGKIGESDVQFTNSYITMTHIDDKVKSIDNICNNIHTDSGCIFKYKHLVLAIGSEPNDFGIPGVTGINPYVNKFKTIQDAKAIREKLSKYSAIIPQKVIIIGTGITGLELGTKIHNDYDIDLTFIETAPTIIPGQILTLSTIKFIQNYLQPIPACTILTNHKVTSVDHDISEKDVNKINTINTSKMVPEPKYHKFKPNDIAIWTGGVRINGYNSGSGLFKSLGIICDNKIKPRGVDVKENFTIDKNIYCIGDMVANYGPPTAQNAKAHGEWLAEYFNNGFKSKTKYSYVSKGTIIHMGDQIYIETPQYQGLINKFVEKLIRMID